MRADPDLWIRLTDDTNSYDYVETHVDDIIIASKDPEQYLNKLKNNFPIRHTKEKP